MPDCFSAVSSAARVALSQLFPVCQAELRHPQQ